MAESEKILAPRYYSPPHWLYGVGAALLAILVYLATSGSVAFPGRSIEILVNYTGIKDVHPLLYPLYHTMVKVFSAIPGLSLPSQLGLLSMLSAMGALVLLFSIMSNLVYKTIEEETPIRTRWLAALGAGLLAVAFLAFCRPFWYAANRADYACFHLLLLLGVSKIFFMWKEQPQRDWLLAVFAFLYGAAITEFASFIIFAPFFGLSILIMLAMSDRLNTRRLLLLIGFGLLGLSLYWVNSYRYFHSPIAVNPASSAFGAFLMIAKAQVSLIMKSLPTVGWLIVGITTFVPWIILLPLYRRGLRSETGWSFIMLHFVFSVLMAALVFDFPLSPWRLLGESNLLVTPYVCAAMVAGYLLAFWIVEERNPWASKNTDRMEFIRRRLCRVMTFALMLLVIIPAGLNYRSSDVRQARVFDVLAKGILRDMGPRTWLVTDGVLDNHLLLAAKKMNRDIRIMDMSRGDEKRQMRMIADQFDSVRLKNQAELGLVPFLQEWMRVDPMVDKKLALMVMPDLWYGSDRVPIPKGILFLGYGQAESVDVEALRQQNRTFWAEVMSWAPKGGTPTALSMWDLFKRQISLMANNMGVLLEDSGKLPEAYATYGLSRSMESNNLSALLNQYAMIKGGYQAPDEVVVSNQLAKIEAEAFQGYNIWGLSRYYGYVRSPEAFANMGWTWAIAGYPGLAVSGLKRALMLSKDAQISDEVDRALASIYMSQGLPEESRKIYTRMLERDKMDVRALLGMAELAIRWRRPDEASLYIDRAEKAGATKAEVAQSWALYHIAIGDNSRARIFLEELVSNYSGMTTPWHMLANVLLVQKDGKALESLGKKIQSLPRQDFHTSRALAIVAASKDDGLAMREYLGQALMYKPQDVGTLDLLLHMDMKEGRQDLAEIHAVELLRARPGHPYGNYVMGSLQMKRREYKLAEDSLSRSITERRTPETLNDLAWAVLMSGRSDEAEVLAKEALAKDNQMAAAWDTLGMTYFKQSKLAEARQALQQALNIMPNLPEFQVHLAEVEMAAKNYQSAEALLQKAAPNADKMWSEEREKLQRLTRELREVNR